MPDPTGFQKARLDIEGGERLECWLNPTQYSIAKANDWTTRPVVGMSLPQAQFAGGHARELALELLFDATPDGDVSTATDQLFKMMEVDQSLAAGGSANQARPPSITLSWGSFTSFKAVCRHLHVQFELFSPDGTPIRGSATGRWYPELTWSASGWLFIRAGFRVKAYRPGAARAVTLPFRLPRSTIAVAAG